MKWTFLNYSRSGGHVAILYIVDNCGLIWMMRSLPWSNSGYRAITNFGWSRRPFLKSLVPIYIKVKLQLEKKC